MDTLREGIFDGCVALNSIRIPGTVKQIDRDAFRRCKSLTKITIPETVESLGYRAFYACERLESVSLSSKWMPSVSGILQMFQIEKSRRDEQNPVD